MAIERDKIEVWVSEKRFKSYLDRCNGDENAAVAYYEANVAISEASYVCLQALEVVLRNKIHIALTDMYERDDWYNEWVDYEDDEGYKELNTKIEDAKTTLKKQKKAVIPSRMIPEFTLGFWVQLFNAEYQMELWKPLRNIFVNLSKDQKQRHVVSAALNKARNFRNRVFHYEPMFWSPQAAYENHQNIKDVLLWLDKEFLDWTESQCRFKETITSHTNKLHEMGVKNVSVKM